ncbi:hypothetical protein DIPPA_01957 [Diplonema papillatum]|nr:hypothetical protein DIPPA_01957 [Diplonema papillatum]
MPNLTLRWLENTIPASVSKSHGKETSASLRIYTLGGELESMEPDDAESTVCTSLQYPGSAASSRAVRKIAEIERQLLAERRQRKLLHTEIQAALQSHPEFLPRRGDTEV